MRTEHGEIVNENVAQKSSFDGDRDTDPALG